MTMIWICISVCRPLYRRVFDRMTSRTSDYQRLSSVLSADVFARHTTGGSTMKGPSCGRKVKDESCGLDESGAFSLK